MDCILTCLCRTRECHLVESHKDVPSMHFIIDLYRETMHGTVFFHHSMTLDPIVQQGIQLIEIATY
jgi:hypothetical protein